MKETVVKTVGEPAKIVLEADRTEIVADGKELAFITVSVVDKNGIICPNADHLIDYSVTGQGIIKAVGNGDPTSLESFVEPKRKAFNGNAMVLVQSSQNEGEIILNATSKGLTEEKIKITTHM